MQEGVGFAVFQKVARTPGETVDQPPLLPSLKRLFDHLEGAPPVVAVHLVGHCEEDAHQLVNRLGKAIVGIVGAEQHALGDSVFLVAPGLASGLVDRKSVVSGKSVSVRVDLGGRRIITKKTQQSSKT